jgi:antagonist of KipI
MANLLVGNDEGEAALEITMVGPKMKALSDTVIAIAGGDLDLRVNGNSVGIGRSIAIRKGDILSFGAPRSGCRTYLSVSGGIDVPEILGSRSTSLRGMFGGKGGSSERVTSCLPRDSFSIHRKREK